MKLFLSILSIIALAVVAHTSSVSWGRRLGGDYLLSRENVVRQPLKNNYWSVNVDFPRPGQYNSRNITAIYVYDRFTNSSGAHPSLWSGGPGWRSATVNLKSQYARGINTSVEFYGR